jgi:hypothetical protein
VELMRSGSPARIVVAFAVALAARPRRRRALGERHVPGQEWGDLLRSPGHAQRWHQDIYSVRANGNQLVRVTNTGFAESPRGEPLLGTVLGDAEQTIVVPPVAIPRAEACSDRLLPIVCARLANAKLAASQRRLLSEETSTPNRSAARSGARGAACG